MTSIVNLENISFSVHYFGDKRILFNKFNLKMDKGDTLFVTGPSGSGKTTLLSIIGTLIKPNKGSVYLFNKKVTQKNKYELRKRIGFIFQTPVFLEYETVKTNILFYGQLNNLNRLDSLERGKNLLKEFNLLKYIQQKPILLSGGERQKLAFILPLIKKPELLIADEPLGCVDPKNRKLLIDSLKLLLEKGITMIYASHDISLKKLANKTSSL
ncbi:MAG: ATP-binding cassette domain-containing protein [Candidatus Heimdallarchaeaceae archaeon]